MSMVIGYAISFFGIMLLIVGWREVYRAHKQGRLATEGPYALCVIRNTREFLWCFLVKACRVGVTGERFLVITTFGSPTRKLIQRSRYEWELVALDSVNRLSTLLLSANVNEQTPQAFR